MDIWWLHALVFVFGYITCKTFYFLNSARISLKLARASQVIYLLTLTKAIEYFVEAENTVINLLGKDVDEKTIENIKIRFENDQNEYKRRAINYLISITPAPFKEDAHISDWDSAMLFLYERKNTAFEFWRIGNDK
jgi:hypothetical protein